MSMLNWAENEIRIACERENPNRKEGEFDYGCACYESALKAFKSLLEDEHSGMSISITRQILNRLILGQPLTPIEDTDNVWNLIHEQKDHKVYQCRRMSSLFKKVYDDGKISYNDVDRVICYEIKSDDIPFRNGLSRNIVDGMFPITMPYIPEEKPYKVYVHEFLTDPKNGDFDTVGVICVVKPDGERVRINRYFKDAEHGYDEISVEEYNERFEIYIANKEKQNDTK